jgi:heme/copper-type cytochrome/quinol oxidase subunit 2
MKIIDDKGKLFGIINIIDLLVLVIILIAIIFIAIRMLPGTEGGETRTQKEMEYTVKVEEVSTYTIDAANVGDAIYDFETGSKIGVISGIDDRPHMEYLVNKDNEATAIESLDKFDLFISIKADFVETDTALMVEDMIVAVGRSVLVYNKYLFVEGKIYSRESGIDE